MVIKYKNGQMAMAHNGNLVNAAKIREKLEEEGIIFQSTIDSEVILNLISRFRLTSNNIEEAIVKVMKEIKGAYSLVILTPNKLIGIRDPHGIRPLCIGRIDDSYFLDFESALFRPYLISPLFPVCLASVLFRFHPAFAAFQIDLALVLSRLHFASVPLRGILHLFSAALINGIALGPPFCCPPRSSPRSPPISIASGLYKLPFTLPKCLSI